MLKFALLSTAVLLAMPLATATDIDAAAASGPSLGAPAEAACLPGRVPDPACPLRAAAGPGGGYASASGPPELAGSVFDWAPRAPDVGLDIADAAGGLALPAGASREPSRRLLPALLALGGLVVLLRRRPT